MLTKKQAIIDCKKIWAHVLNGEAEDKSQALKLEMDIKNKGYYHDCPLCHYDNQYNCDCNSCPLYTEFNIGCCEDNSDYMEYPKEFAKLVMKLDEDK